MQAARQGLLFPPLRPRGPLFLPLPAPAPSLLPARLPPRATDDWEQASRLLVSRLRLTKDVLKAIWDLVANCPSPSPMYDRLRHRSYLRALLERLARRDDALSLAAILAAALLFYILLRRWAAEGAVAADDEDEEADAIIRSGRLPPSTRRRLLILALQLVPRGPGAGARRPPWAWTVRHSIDGHTAAAMMQPEESDRLIFGGRKTMLSHGRSMASQPNSLSSAGARHGQEATRASRTP